MYKAELLRLTPSIIIIILASLILVTNLQIQATHNIATPASGVHTVGTGPVGPSCPSLQGGTIEQTNTSILINGHCLVYRSMVAQNLTITDKCFYCWLEFNMAPKTVLNIIIAGNQTIIDVRGSSIAPQFQGYDNILRVKSGILLLGDGFCLTQETAVVFVTCGNLHDEILVGT